ncbi:pyruvate formate lyase activating enzyme [Alkalithermobacter thermoalcaliphilus JW-YL-7 = DSM 7308]|uniref:Pyruvate formate-lyase-activating enzyme n=1 Tax=Alkalithermobacter thermoalcaliphilus JW-YL-7 = DSM 7308 TaxID=1121328 RepID=A0A150FP66_CLOPD|nr:pyruvate formate-lyase activating enzyme [[Clostridium] paradoxum JW-YL-7 = DSM 7308]SHK54021.1 pyruvate formate lyase activating enzyme [[Clostridium] paradoxum JW-YL-7 = DSM 7308]
MEILGKVHSIETFGTVDGPGIRYVIFLQGCPLRCKYCHNRDTWDVNGGSEYTVSYLIDDIKKYLPFIKSSGGGITVSGGEPMLQPDFVKELLKRAKANDIHTAIDTSGFVNIDVIDPILDYTDLVLLDIKHIDNKICKDLTGVSNDKTLNLAKHLSNRNIPVWIRYVLVPGITDSPEHLEELAKFLSSLNNIENIEILPYHTAGSFKWEQLGIEYPLKGIRQATDEDVLKARKIFEKHGLIAKKKAC